MPSRIPSSGRLDSGAIRKDTLVERTIEFVWNCLLPWRDDPQRPRVEGEEDINSSFCDFLDSNASRSFSMVRFHHEQRQTEQRRADFGAKPNQTTLIRGETYSIYKPFLVMEGKRLPAPKKSREREYISGGEKATGGIQRFKLGLHGKEHNVAIMLGYIQQDTPQEWLPKINSWINELADSDSAMWSKTEILSALQPQKPRGRTRATSTHSRIPGCRSKQIHLHHFWIALSPHPDTLS